MKDERKTKNQLVSELKYLCQELAAIQTLGDERKLEQRIFEHKQTEPSETTELYEAVVQNISDAISIYMDRKRVFANRAFRSLLGCESAPSALAVPASEFVHPEDWPLVEGRIQARLSGDLASDTFEFRILLPNGQVRLVEASFLGINYVSKPAHLSVLRDITERKHSEEELRNSLEKAKKVIDGTVKAIASIVEMRDPYTAGHQLRVASLATAIAREIGLADEQMETIRIASLVHDIGKTAVPAETLSKPSKLNRLEMSLVWRHPEIGYSTLDNIDFPSPVARIVLQHHERMDGSGYPKGLFGKQILQEAKIVAVADVVEAMSSHRPYRPALGVEKALEEISWNRGTLYDPYVVDACIRLFTEKGFQFE